MPEEQRASTLLSAVSLRSWTNQSDFKLKELLTKGSYGRVYLASHVKTERDLIVKAVHKYAPRGPGELSPEEELSLHNYVSKRMPDPSHVAKLIAGYEDETYVYSVMEACRGPTIQALLDVAGGPLEERDAAFLLQQAATRIQQLHSIGVVHRDVKPDNFMFCKYDETSPLVVIDFGLSLLLGNRTDFSSKWTVGSFLYVAPEVTNRGFYTYACDVWSLGVLLYRMLFAREPWSSFEEAADAETLPLPEAGHMVSQEALDLLRNMLKHDHEARATVKQVLESPFVKKAAGDIDHLVHAWRVAKEAEAATTSSNMLQPSSHLQSRSSLNRERQAASHTSQHSCSALSSHTHHPSVRNCSSSLPIRIDMPPSDLLDISPPGPCRDPYVASPTSHLSHISSSPPSPRSDMSSSPSLPPNYPDLPSLTMPVSIRRAYSSAALHAQCRVQMLSNEAEQAWQDPSAAGALMHYAHEDLDHEPEAVHSETRKMARELQSSRPHFMHGNEHAHGHGQLAPFQPGLPHPIGIGEDLAPLPEEPGEGSSSPGMHTSFEYTDRQSLDKGSGTELESSASIGPLVIGSAPAQFALLHESGGMSPEHAAEADALIAAAGAALATGGSHSGGRTCPGSLDASPSARPLRIAGRGGRSAFGSDALLRGNVGSAPEPVLTLPGPPQECVSPSGAFLFAADHAALSEPTSTPLTAGSVRTLVSGDRLIVSSGEGSPTVQLITPPHTPTRLPHSATSLGGDGRPMSAGATSSGRDLATVKSAIGTGAVFTPAFSSDPSPSSSGRKPASYVVNAGSVSTAARGLAGKQMKAIPESIASCSTTESRSGNYCQPLRPHSPPLQGKDSPASHSLSCTSSVVPTSSTIKPSLTNSGVLNNKYQASPTIAAGGSDSANAEFLGRATSPQAPTIVAGGGSDSANAEFLGRATSPQAQGARTTQLGRFETMLRREMDHNPWPSISGGPALGRLSEPVPHIMSNDEGKYNHPLSCPSMRLSIDQRTSKYSFRILQSLLEDRGR